MQTKRNTRATLEEKCAWMRARHADRRKGIVFPPEIPDTYPEAEQGTCRRCGKSFTPPLRADGTPSRPKFCGRCNIRGCNTLGLGKRCNALAANNAAYLAGFFNGEGCISVHQRSKRSRRHSLEMHVVVCNTDFQVVEWIGRITGTGSVSMVPRSSPAHKDYKVWNASSIGAASFLEQLLPFLKIKRHRAIRFLEVYGQCVANPKLCKTLEWQMPVLKEFRRLNRKGKPIRHVRAAGGII